MSHEPDPNGASGAGAAPAGGNTATSSSSSSGGVVHQGGGTQSGGTQSGGTTGSGTQPPPDPLALHQSCAGTASGGVLDSIEATVRWINAQPKPLTLACFLQSLQKPLKLNATYSIVSAQPSMGTRSPRLFIFFDGLILSVVPEGTGSSLLELGQLDGETRTVKAEIQFPVTQTLAPEAPFERVLYMQAFATVCGGCHGSEARYESIAYAKAYVSKAIRPEPSYAVPLSTLQRELAVCDDTLEFDRCEMLRALQQGGPISQDFPPGMSTSFF
ncbi:MAG TPA: hypothetical protein VFQ61_10300 [Polyangiaceae bacterium]|nr:hypothetical protein [Polyangiaceae bacterium]